MGRSSDLVVPPDPDIARTQGIRTSRVAQRAPKPAEPLVDDDPLEDVAWIVFVVVVAIVCTWLDIK